MTMRTFYLFRKTYGIVFFIPKNFFQEYFPKLHHFPRYLCITSEGPSQNERRPKGLQDQNEYLSYLVETYGDMVYRIAVTRVRSPQDAEDIVQQVFMKLVKNIDSLESEEHVKAWLIRVAVNEGKSLFSSSWRRRVLSIEDLGAAGELSVRQPEVRESNRIMDAVFRLPEKYRVVVHLFYYHDLSTDEIAKVLGRSNHTVRSQLSRAREKMRSDLKEVFDDVR